MKKWGNLSGCRKVWRVTWNSLCVYGLTVVIIVIIRVSSVDKAWERENYQLAVSAAAAENVHYKIGDVVQTKYFAVKVLESFFRPQRLSKFGNPAGSSNQYLIIKLELQNMDTEARMLTSLGALTVSINGKKYQSDSSETVLNKRFLSAFESLNPLVKKIGYIAFKISDTFSMSDISYIPPRSSGQKIQLGEK